MINLLPPSTWHTFRSHLKFSFTSIITPLLCSDPWLRKTSPLRCDFHPNSTEFVSWRYVICDLLFTDQLKMAFLSQWIHSLEHTKTIVYNVNWVSLSYILISGENNGKAVEDKVRHSCTLHIYLLIKSQKNNYSHKELTQYLKIKERSAKPVNCATFDW